MGLVNEHPRRPDGADALAWLEMPPRTVPAPISVSAPPRLPFDQLTSDDFERLILAMAGRRYAVEDARQYGVRGQKQHGIDLYCRLVSPDDSTHRYVTIQCRNIVEVRPSAFSAAVEAFLVGTWADRTETFVYATRASMRRVELVEAIEASADRLRVERIGFEVWDGDSLSEQLRDDWDLVSLFFGPATAEIYCTAPPVPEAQVTTGWSATKQTGLAASATVRASSLAVPELPEEYERVRTPVFGRWRLVRPGDPIRFGLNNLKDISSPHQGSYRSWDVNTPPSVSIGISIACEPLLADMPSTSQIRQGFRRLLAESPIQEFVGAVNPAATEPWRSHNDIGRAHYAAIVTSESASGAPLAWARLLLPTPDQHSAGLDPRCACFILHVDWAKHGEDANLPPVNLHRWRAMMALALALPAAIAGYLADQLGVHVDSDPKPMIGFWLATSSDLTQLIDINGLTYVEGSHLSRWYDAYAVTDGEGKEREEMAADWLTQLCDVALHLDGYEDAI